MKKETNKPEKNYQRPIWGILIMLLSILFLVAISVNITQLYFDYKILSETGLSFFKFIKLQFPPVSNPIGPFGVFFGYWMVYTFGKFFSLSLLLGTAFLGFFLIFFRDNKFVGKMLLFLVFASS